MNIEFDIFNREFFRTLRNFILMVKMFWLSGTADRAIHVHQISGVNGNREHEKKIKEIPLLIDFVSLIIVHYSYLICFPI